MNETKFYLVILRLYFNFIEENRFETSEEIRGIFDNADKARELAQNELVRTRNIIGDDKVVKEGVDRIEYLVEGGEAKAIVRIEQVNKMNVELSY